MRVTPDALIVDDDSISDANRFNTACIMYRPSLSGVSQLAPLGVSVLICILAYGSQIFFSSMEPYHLDRNQTIIFNVLVACIWICYFRACLTDPGYIPPDWNLQLTSGTQDRILQRQRWCRKCDASKPPRAHHCKTCKRYTSTDQARMANKSLIHCSDASRRWTITAHGPSTAFLIVRFPTSCVFSYMA